MSATPFAFYFDANRCTSCAACVIACQIENRDLSDPAAFARPLWRTIYVQNPGHLPGRPTFALSLACQHCADPACRAACPASAYRKDAHTGAVTIDPDRCIGCRYCIWACPYGAPQYDPLQRIVEKCTFCDHRLQTGGQPACAVACPTGALAIGPHVPPAGTSPDIAGFPRTRLRPAIHFTPLRLVPHPLPPLPSPGGSADVQDTESPSAREGRRNEAREVRLASEWPLWLLTTAVPAAFAWFAAGRHGPWWSDVGFLAIGGLALALSTAHLGRPLRAWRAVLNWRTSWLSREIILVLMLMGLSALLCAVRVPLWPRPWSVEIDGLIHGLLLAVGSLALLAIDQVYAVLPLRFAPPDAFYRPRPRPHSAWALLSGLYLAGLLAAGRPEPAGVELVLVVAGAAAGLAQLILYLRQYLHRPAGARDPWRAALRLGFGFAVPALLLAAGQPAWLAFGLAVAGAAIDRAEFYADLQPVRPGMY